MLPVGGAVMFSANQLHATTENVTGKTRFSIDFRIVDGAHVAAGLGALNVDNRSGGTALRDFLRVADETGLDEDLVRRYDSGGAGEGDVLVFRPEAATGM